MSTRRATLAAAVVAVLVSAPFVTHAQTKPAPPKSVRLYIFDCGVIKGLGVELFGFKPGEVPVRDFFVPCYLVVHPRGTMMWDVGVIPDSSFKGDGAPVTDGRSTVNKPLLPQLAALGYTPADITYLGLSHYHSDHTANANAFAGSTWLVRLAERDMMFNPPQGAIVQQASFSALKTAKTKILNDDEYDVFGDGAVVIKSAPGHTPGHQVLFLKLNKFGPLVVAGDLYHYPEEKAMNRFPGFEFSKEQSAKSRTDIDAYLKAKKAQMWIEHDAATNATLKKAPEYYE
jgi:glyoxylase-like metal-dependent hydrolase (beta-lactamase superfamily II)